MRKIILKVLSKHLPVDIIRHIDSYVDFIAKAAFEYKKIKCKTRKEKIVKEHFIVRRRAYSI